MKVMFLLIDDIENTGKKQLVKSREY